MNNYRFDHVGLSFADLDAQRRFYADALGLVEVVGHHDLPAARIRTVIFRSRSGLQIELIEREGSTPQSFSDAEDCARTQGYFHWALEVDDLDPAFTDVLAAGATPVSSPADASRPGFRFAYVKDPEANLIEIIEPVSARHA